MGSLTELQRERKMAYHRKRIVKKISAQKERPLTAWYFSFADEKGFRGAVITHGSEFLEALMQVNLRGLNPHGEVQGMPIAADLAGQIPERWKNRLLSAADVATFNLEMENR